jgi:hypothetical protein
MIMNRIPAVGCVPVPAGFKYARIMEKGKPVHDDDYFLIRHPRMNTGKRAKIFAPFAALRGFEEEVQAKDIIYVSRRQPGEDRIRTLESRLNLLHRLTEKAPGSIAACAEYFVPCTDPHHDDYLVKGVYRSYTGPVYAADPLTQELRIGELTIRFRDLFSLTVSEP